MVLLLLKCLNLLNSLRVIARDRNPLAGNIIRNGLHASTDHAVLRNLLKRAVTYERGHWVLPELVAVLLKAAMNCAIKARVRKCLILR